MLDSIWRFIRSWGTLIIGGGIIYVVMKGIESIMGEWDRDHPVLRFLLNAFMIIVGVGLAIWIMISSF